MDLEIQREVVRDEYADCVNSALDATDKLEMERVLERLQDSLWELWRLSGGTDE
jgi:hypothetical protein